MRRAVLVIFLQTNNKEVSQVTFVSRLLEKSVYLCKAGLAFQGAADGLIKLTKVTMPGQE